MPPIGPFFYGQERTGAFSTEATNTFTYHARTVPVAEAVVEAAERDKAMQIAAEDRAGCSGNWETRS